MRLRVEEVDEESGLEGEVIRDHPDDEPGAQLADAEEGEDDPVSEPLLVVLPGVRLDRFERLSNGPPPCDNQTGVPQGGVESYSVCVQHTPDAVACLVCTFHGLQPERCHGVTEKSQRCGTS